MTLPFAFSRPIFFLVLLTLPLVVWVWRRSFGRPTGRARASLGLRLAILALLVLALTGAEWVRVVDDLAVVLMLDVSDSIGSEGRDQGVAVLRDVLSQMGPHDQAAWAVFGTDAWVEWELAPAGTPFDPDHMRSAPDTGHTDLGEAIRLGLALLPAGAQRRLVLLSDGRATLPGGAEAAALVASAGAVLDVVPLRGGGATPEAWLDRVEVPRTLYEGETASLVVHVRSETAQPAILRVFGPGETGAGQRLLAEKTVQLSKGASAFRFDLSAVVGFNAWSVQLAPWEDGFVQNNALDAFTIVHGAPRVALVAPADGTEEASLLPALERVGLSVTRLAPGHLSVDLTDLGSYDALVLANVPALSLSTAQMKAIESAVRDLGCGLVCIGGGSSYGVGGYYRTPLEDVLPVEMALRDRTRMPPLAIAFVIDRSGSMDMGSQQGGGVRKLDLAKEAVLRSLDLLYPGDQVAVIAFENAAQWVYPAQGGLGALDDRTAVQERVATIRAGGGTDIYAGLSAAVRAMEESSAQVKHVILLTDGGASPEGLSDWVARLRQAGGTLSTIAVGQDAAPFLATLAIDGGGRYHYTDDPTTIPQILTQETMVAQRAAIVEETFAPSLAGASAIVDGFTALPLLRGYVATSLKPAARLVLVSPFGDPILAQWQVGLGRAVAWTSDAKGQWAVDWVRWEGFPRFWGQAVRWTIAERDESGIEIELRARGESVSIAVDVQEDDPVYGSEMQVDVRAVPSLGPLDRQSSRVISLALGQTGPRRYEGELPLDAQGTYVVQVSARPAAQGAETLDAMVGYVQAYSPEYRALGTDDQTLSYLADLGGGRVRDPAVPDQIAGILAHDLDAVRARSPIWPWLVGVAACLLPLDVAVRRLTIDMADLRHLGQWAHARLRRWIALLRPATPQPVPEGLSRLLQAKRRVSRADLEGEGGRTVPVSEQVHARETGTNAAPAPGMALDRAVEDAGSSSTQPSTSGEAGSLASRLLASRRRAAERDEDSAPPDERAAS